MRDAVICEPLRTPVGGFGGSLRDVPAQDLAATVIRAIVERTGLPPESVDDVLLGHCYPTMDAPALGRVAALDAVLEGGVEELVVDLSEVTFLDSAGLCVLAAAHRRAGGQGVRMRVLAASRAVIRPLQITGLWALLGASEVSSDAGAV